jgi:hypothetical protein
VTELVAVLLCISRKPVVGSSVHKNGRSKSG